MEGEHDLHFRDNGKQPVGIIIISAAVILCLVFGILFFVFSGTGSIKKTANASVYSSEFESENYVSEDFESSFNEASEEILSSAEQAERTASIMAKVNKKAAEIKPSTGNVFTAPEYKYVKKEDAGNADKKNVDSDKAGSGDKKLEEITTKPSSNMSTGVSSKAPGSVSSKAQTTEKTKYVVVTGSNVNVRDNPTTSGTKVLGSANKNDEFLYLGEKNNSAGQKWYKINFKGKEAWIISKYSKIVEKGKNESDTTPASSESSKTDYSGWTTLAGKTYYYLDGKPLKGWKVIDGIRYHFNESSGVKDSSAGIDVSYWQGNINWNKVKASGIEFAFIRVGYRGYGEEGKLCLDPNFKKNLDGAKKAGIQCGVYFYSVAKNVTEAVQEANLVLEAIKGYTLELPVIIDCEHKGDRVKGLTKAERTDNVLAFLETVKKAGRKGGLYTGHWYYKNLLEPKRLASVELWIAYYTENQNKVSDVEYKYWQYSDSGSIGGISGKVDLNIWIKK